MIKLVVVSVLIIAIIIVGLFSLKQTCRDYKLFRDYIKTIGENDEL